MIAADRPGGRSLYLSIPMALFALIFGCTVVLGQGGQEPDYVTGSDPLTADQEREAIRVPPGFEIQLVASEPAIAKPISMAFDAAGRLWVAETRTYPIETADDKSPRDSIRILSNFGKDGRARRIETFADGLTMPDAVAPYKDGAVIFSLPNILDFRDLDGDGRADRHNMLYGPFDARDMHNMANNFRRGFDGWFYGCHGFANSSTVSGRDGPQITMSGATFRFREDGSRVELFGRGQVNPFGLCFDPLGNVYASDCHSSPIYELLRGAYYPSFGRPHDGLGFGPVMMRHTHDSTAIAGLCYYDDNLWPEEYRGNMFLGNVVTNRVNRDRLTETGSTKTAHEMPDLVVSSDPWFRPVDVQLGPDGALYIADFYNRIIAHVEVPLDHPGRDRDRGRIWRVVYRGENGKAALRPPRELTKASVSDVVAALADPNFTVRHTALNQLADVGGPEVIRSVGAVLRDSAADEHTKSAALWILERLNAIEAQDLNSALRHPSRMVRTHAVRVLAERPMIDASQRMMLIKALRDPDALVQRTAADAMARHPADENVMPLLALLQHAPSGDTQLIFMCRKALRDQLLAPEAFDRLNQLTLSIADLHTLADVCLAIPLPDAASFLLDFIDQHAVEDGRLTEYVQHIARYHPEAELNSLANWARTEFTGSLDNETDSFLALLAGLEQRGGATSAAIREWGAELAARLLDPATVSQPDERSRTIPDRQTIAAKLAAKLKLTSLETRLAKIASNRLGDTEARTSALLALLALNPPAHLSDTASLLKDESLPLDRRDEIARAVGEQNTTASRALLVDALSIAPQRVQGNLALALVSTPEGADALLRTIIEGKVSAQVLADSDVKHLLAAVRPGDARAAKIISELKPMSDHFQKIIEQCRTDYHKSNPDAGHGKSVFQTKCAACHSIAGQGGDVGPNLDGIGQRGLERLCEDIIDPNRNVDHAFRASLLLLDDGRAVSGLVRREEGNLLVLADAAGKEVSVPKHTIDERHEIDASLMPEGIAGDLPPEDFYDLLAFLLSQRTSQTNQPADRNLRHGPRP